MPFGNPERVKRSSMNLAHPGTFEACFRTITLPAMTVGAATRMKLPEWVVPRHQHECRTAPIGSYRMPLRDPLVETASSRNIASACSA